MKTRLNKSTIAASTGVFFLLLILSLSLLSCAPLLLRNGGMIILDLGTELVERAVYPFDAAQAKIHHYTITLSGPANYNETIEDVRQTIVEKPYLAPGTWTVSVVAYNEAGNILGRGETSGEVTSTKATRLRITIMPSGEGSIQIEVNWNGNPLVKANMSVELGLLLEGSTEYVPVMLERETDRATYLADLTSGTYNVLLKLKDSENRVLWGYLETFYIYENLKTSKQYSILPGQMNSAPENAPQIRTAQRGHDRLSLIWNEGSARTEKYILERKQGDGEWISVATVDSYVLSWTDYGLQNATTYRYRLRAENYFGTSAWSDELEVKTLPVKEVGGLLSENATWSSDIVYHMTKNMKVPQGITLRIQPGTKIMIDPGLYLQIEGELVARGLPEAPILFGYGSSGWSYITFIDKAIDATYMNGHYQAGSALQYVMIRGGGRIGIERSKPFLDHIDIADVTSGHSISIILDGDMTEGLKISKSIIGTNYSGNWGIHVSNYGKIIIEENEINARYGIFVESGKNPGRISKNIIKTQGNGIWLGERYNEPGEELMISNNTVTSSYPGGSREGVGIGLGWANHQNVIIEGNDISGKEYGIMLDVNAISGITIRNNKVSSCRVGGWFRPYYANSNPAVVFEGNSIVDSYDIGQFYNFYQNHATMWKASGNYFDNPKAAWEVQLGEWMKAGETVLNLGENYWSTNDPEAVKERIYDASRDFIYGTVLVDPVKKLDGIKVDLLSPAHEANLSSSAIEFGWKAIGRASSYELQVASDTAFTSLVGSREEIIDTSWKLGRDAMFAGMKDGTTYYWRVAAKDAGGQRSPWSIIRSFTIGIPGALPVKPVDGEIQYDDFSPTLAWEPPSIDASYRVQVDYESDFATPMYDSMVIGSTEYSIPKDLAPEQTYFWRVYVVDSNGVQAKNPSVVQRFVLPKPGLVTLLEDRLPKAIELTIDGPEKVSMSGGAIFGIKVNVSPQKVRWMLNGNDAGTGMQMSFPAMRKGFYPVTALILYQDRWYTATKLVQVVMEGEAIQ